MLLLCLEKIQNQTQPPKDKSRQDDNNDVFGVLLACYCWCLQVVLMLFVSAVRLLEKVCHSVDWCNCCGCCYSEMKKAFLIDVVAKKHGTKSRSMMWIRNEVCLCGVDRENTIETVNGWRKYIQYTVGSLHTRAPRRWFGGSEGPFLSDTSQSEAWNTPYYSLFCTWCVDRVTNVKIIIRFRPSRGQYVTKLLPYHATIIIRHAHTTVGFIFLYLPDFIGFNERQQFDRFLIVLI